MRKWLKAASEEVQTGYYKKKTNKKNHSGHSLSLVAVQEAFGQFS